MFFTFYMLASAVHILKLYQLIVSNSIYSNARGHGHSGEDLVGHAGVLADAQTGVAGQSAGRALLVAHAPHHGRQGRGSA